MAEERLIDDDKDKKYRFRINADGEEELVLDPDGGEREEADGAEEGQICFDDAPYDEEYAFGGEEQAAYEADVRARNFEEYMAAARADGEAGKYSTALEYLEKAKGIYPDDGGLAALELRLYTKDLTDFSQGALQGAADAAERVAENCTPEQKSALYEMGGGPLGGMIGELQTRCDELGEANQRGKAERAEAFAADNKRALTFFLCTLAAFIATAVPAGVFAAFVYGANSGIYVALTIVFGVAAVLSFAAFLIASRRLSTTSRRVRMNRDDSRTKVGREYLACTRRLQALRSIYDAISPTKNIS